MTKVFISHRHRSGGEGYAHIIAHQLKEMGIEFFLDTRSIENGEFLKDIDEAINNCTDFLIIMTPGCFISKGKDDVFMHEVDLALKREGTINILPVPTVGFSFSENSSETENTISKYQNATGNNVLNLTETAGFFEKLFGYFKDKKDAARYIYKLKRYLLSEDCPTHLSTRKNLENDTLDERWKGAKRVKILSVSASAITEANRSALLNCMDDGVYFDVIIYNPLSDAAHFATRANLSTGSTDKMIDHIRNGYNNLMDIKKDPRYAEKLTVRLTNQYIPAAFSIVEREGKGSSCVKVDIVAMSATDFDPRSARAYEIYENDEDNYQYYCKMFDAVAKRAMDPTQSIQYGEKCDMCLNLERDKRLLFRTKYWSAYFADNQDYLGRVILMLNEHKEKLSALSEKEWKEMHKVVECLESLYTKRFHATMMNWECLMNGAYRSTSPKPHVHIHCIPRFKEPVRSELLQKPYVDTEFGSHPIVDKYYEMREETKDALCAIVKSEIGKFAREAGVSLKERKK